MNKQPRFDMERDYPAWYDDFPRLSVDDRQELPFSCSICGRTYEACRHWALEDLH